jgi:cytochrome P450
MVKGDLWRALARLHDQFGDTIRITPNEVTTISTSAWHEIYTTQPLLLKDTFSQTPPMNGSHSLFTAENETHKRIRGILAFSFSGKALREQAALVEHHNSRFVARIDRELEQQDILDMNKLYGYVAFDTITDLSYGESTGCLDIHGSHSWIEKFFLHAQYSAIRNSLRWYSPVDKILDFFFLGLTRKTRKKNWAIAAGKIERRLSNPEGEARADLLTPVIGRVVTDDAEKKNSPQKGITNREILSNALAMVIADCQLTSAALTSCTYFILKCPQTLEELVREVRGAFRRDQDITVQGVQDLAYLGAVLNETLRIHHPSPISLPRSIPANSSRVISGTLIPGNVCTYFSLSLTYIVQKGYISGKITFYLGYRWGESPKHLPLSKILAQAARVSSRAVFTNERFTLQSHFRW